MSLIHKLPGVAFTDATLPKLYRDAIVNSGSKFLFDFSNSWCWPKQANPVITDTFVNLIDGLSGATISGTNGGLTYGGGGIYMPGYTGGAGSSSIELGANYSIGADASPNALIIDWIKLPTGYDTGSTVFFRKATNSGNTYNNAQWSFEAAGNILSIRFGSNVTYFSYTLPVNVPVQMAVNITNTLLTLFINGVAVATAVPSVGLVAADNLGLCRLPYFKGYTYRIYGENLLVSGKNAAAQVLLDYNNNVSKYS
ncbi:hypothetical protein BDD43_2849 [Mucilaginibacter gracilis]|uniref:Concanavalin A-like lectin/glucanase superfamily protein n=1 Tax=Mucilaginibacter gracilis TaxID=423350 RepID=A0A495J2T6_9SPHI|nr:hypothetical protein [Mucilaginibacter gracilis]RKR82664.1 hypothetical protein BDD43_2849 [Mucilaginibacter gracilis]